MQVIAKRQGLGPGFKLSHNMIMQSFNDEDEFSDEDQLSHEDQLSRLRAAHTLLQAGIRHTVWAEYAMGIAHRIPISWTLFNLELLVSPYDLTRAAHLICLKHPYTPIDVRRARYWEGNPKPFSPLSTVVLRHRDYPDCYKANEPPDIYLHTASTFHFDIHDPRLTTTHPCPPNEASGRLLYPSLLAFCNSIIDTIHEPPLPFYHPNFYSNWLGFLDFLCGYAVGEKGYYTKDGKLIGTCERLLQEIKEENRPFLSRLFYDIGNLPLQTSAFERLLIKDVRCKRESLPFRCPHVLPYSDTSDIKKFLTKREVLREIKMSTAMNPAAMLWRFSPSSFRKLFHLAFRR